MHLLYFNTASTICNSIYVTIAINKKVSTLCYEYHRLNCIHCILYDTIYRILFFLNCLLNYSN